MEIIFWISLFIIFYTYLGYGFILYLILLIRRIIKGKRPEIFYDWDDLPTCTLLIAAYNEENFISEKIRNTLALEYPDGKLEVIFITDGSTDRTPDILKEYPQIKLLHQTERKGKIAAMHRALAYVKTEVIIFTDANTELNKDALCKISRHYADESVGAVAGEKRIKVKELADAGTAGEGFYWRYESILKNWDSELYSTIGAAGELFSVRSDLYQTVENDTILDDFMISMLIALKGYRIIYEPEAYAIETASENITEELKRKIRIAAGGIQSILRLKELLNIFRFGTLSFQYISHRVLRWTISPFLLVLVLILNILIPVYNDNPIYSLLLLGQVIFYLLAILGLIFEKRQLRVKLFFIPYYFCVMNYAVLAGLKRYLGNQQSAVWEKAKRKNVT
ncbi:MAG: glycosyl transferase [Sphingobacteriales bacterium 17-39-43]|uniref:glycosyltransferase family 2 protein n=1 Tax=Daejeonella sp. TaxID=2805397 RepID=UPI000BD8DE5F|nr:glycosyltransferase family 2 protein [Daejeonella sp.]OYZ30897.1 MAG: glycosyl transferase [Sphingobacteriales bacterium 16-39-50]OZA23683.1 MAG: glycosyl transferase [Sphingobacteriales bacterium 17-39-43]HQT23449.1 glycosyltransferase family 2 protein [Daejeonella sp.]HQT58326.1 glycosyltransferase family 2 protein [Daejeonella sp.]